MTQTLPAKNPLLVCTPVPRRIEVVPTTSSPLWRNDSQTESYNYPPSDIVVDRTTPLVISTPMQRRLIALEQDSEVSPQKREPHPEPASNQTNRGSTMDLDPSDKEETESLEEDYKDPEPTWIRRITVTRPV